MSPQPYHKNFTTACRCNDDETGDQTVAQAIPANMNCNDLNIQQDNKHKSKENCNDNYITHKDRTFGDSDAIAPPWWDKIRFVIEFMVIYASSCVFPIASCCFLLRIIDRLIGNYTYKRKYILHDSNESKKNNEYTQKRFYAIFDVPALANVTKYIEYITKAPACAANVCYIFVGYDSLIQNTTKHFCIL